MHHRYETVKGRPVKAWISVYVPDADIDNLVVETDYRYCLYPERFVQCYSSVLRRHSQIILADLVV